MYYKLANINHNLYWVVRGVAPEPLRRALPLDPAKRACPLGFPLYMLSFSATVNYDLAVYFICFFNCVC